MIPQLADKCCIATDRAGRWALVLLVWQLTACGDDSYRKIQVTSIQPGATPFISQVELTGPELLSLSHVSYYISPKAGSASAPVQVRYSLAALQRKGAVSASAPVTIKVLFPDLLKCL
jgi:hypothetical protein